MGYNIYIGEAEIAAPSSDTRYSTELSVRVKTASHPNAPEFDGDRLNGKINSRHPDYGAWMDFCLAADLHEMFFDADIGLFARHPGCCLVTPRHVARVGAAIDRWRSMYPDAAPGFVGDQDPTLARLLWLHWWMTWAVASCKVPAIQNG